MYAWNRIFLFCFLPLSFLCAACQTESKPIKKQNGVTKALEDRIPQPQGFVNDFENLYTIKEQKLLDSLLVACETETTIQMAVVTIDTTMTTKNNLDDFTLKLANTWGIGHKNKNNGIVIGISKGHRKMRIQNGHGTEQTLSDSETKQIVEDNFIAHFKKGEYFEGTREGIESLFAKLRTKLK